MLDNKAHIRNCCNNSRQNTHDTIKGDCNSVTSTTVSRRKHLWRIRVERGIVYIRFLLLDAIIQHRKATYQAEIDSTIESQVFGSASDLSIAEEEYHGH
jgi:hypothetical protein